MAFPQTPPIGLLGLNQRRHGFFTTFGPNSSPMSWPTRINIETLFHQEPGQTWLDTECNPFHHIFIEFRSNLPLSSLFDFRCHMVPHQVCFFFFEPADSDTSLLAEPRGGR
jgi:hypothetical protein